MIQSIRGDLIGQVLAGRPNKGFPANLFRVAVRKVAEDRRSWDWYASF